MNEITVDGWLYMLTRWLYFAGVFWFIIIALGVAVGFLLRATRRETTIDPED